MNCQPPYSFKVSILLGDLFDAYLQFPAIIIAYTMSCWTSKQDAELHQLDNKDLVTYTNLKGVHGIERVRIDFCVLQDPVVNSELLCLVR